MRLLLSCLLLITAIGAPFASAQPMFAPAEQAEKPTLPSWSKVEIAAARRGEMGHLW
jgi:hypothetical protein